jgi:hypothetical protein
MEQILNKCTIEIYDIDESLLGIEVFGMEDSIDDVIDVIISKHIHTNYIVLNVPPIYLKESNAD